MDIRNRRRIIHQAALGLAMLLIAGPAQGSDTVQAGARVYVNDMDGFGPYLAAAIARKKVPVALTSDRSTADFEIQGSSVSQNAGWQKMMFSGTAASREEAGIMVIDVRSGDVVFAANVTKENAVRGKQSSAEALAKRFRKHIESRD